MRYNPYANLGKDAPEPIKVNFHTHAGVCQPGLCGILPLAEVIAAYRQAGYGALAISNHDTYIPYTPQTDIAVLDAVEYSATPHMVLVGTRNFHDVSHQEAIELARGEGAFVIIAHPNLNHPEYWPMGMLKSLKGYTGIEIMNQVIYRLKGSGLALDVWDALLSSGRCVWGFGSDDFHLWHDMARAYNLIYADSPDYSDIKAAVEAGRFCVSTGLVLQELALGEHELELEVSYPVSSCTNQFDYQLVGEKSRVLDHISGRRARLRFDPSEPYVRAEARAENGALLFLQPMMLA